MKQKSQKMLFFCPECDTVQLVGSYMYGRRVRDWRMECTECKEVLDDGNRDDLPKTLSDAQKGL